MNRRKFLRRASGVLTPAIIPSGVLMAIKPLVVPDDEPAGLYLTATVDDLDRYRNAPNTIDLVDFLKIMHDVLAEACATEAESVPGIVSIDLGTACRPLRIVAGDT